MKLLFAILVLTIVVLGGCRDDDFATEQATETEQPTDLDCEETPEVPECEFPDPSIPPIPPVPFLNK